MSEDFRLERYFMDYSGFFIEEREIHPPSFSILNVSKVRRAATPYGFGVDLNSLSPLQIAILAALGISLL
jgi:hypothetical protein